MNKAVQRISLLHRHRELIEPTLLDYLEEVESAR